ncbi:MAG: FtsX-like permease family protein [Firmicutes bacterium]|nr:FtsX-like permease family protein [Bacillota bacterium]
MAILLIVALGVGFFAGLRMCQPAMQATGIKYLNQYGLHDFRLISTLGFTDEDVEAFQALDGIALAEGSYQAEFLWQSSPDEVQVLLAHAITEQLNLVDLRAGRLPANGSECLADYSHFTEESIGTTIKVSDLNDEDTLDMLVYDEYTIVGLTKSPMYLNHDRGTASIGNGTLTAFLYVPKDGFDSEAYHEIYLQISDAHDAYSDEYDDQIDAIKPQIEDFLEERGDLRYVTLYNDALDEIHEGEQELADGWIEYRQERADAEQEIADALVELQDAEIEYADGVADYEQGLIDYEEGLADFQQGKIDYADGKAEYEDGLQKYLDGLAEYEDGVKKLEDAEKELESARKKLSSASRQLSAAKAELEAGEANYDQLNQLYSTAAMITSYLPTSSGITTPNQLISAMEVSPYLYSQIDAMLQGYGSSADQLITGWRYTEAQIGEPLTGAYVSGVRSQLDSGWSQYNSGLAKYRSGRSQYNKGYAEFLDAKKELEEARIELEDAAKELADAEIELKDASKELIDGALELADARKQLDDAPGELADARKEIDDGWVEYYDGIEEAKREFAKAEKELYDGEQDIKDAYVELADLKPADTYALTRKENSSYAYFYNDISVIAAVSVVFPAFFFMVAALVCTTTMKRMVEEQRTQIGVLKALGYSRRQIIGKFLFYSGSAAITGSVLGYFLGQRGLPLIIWEIYGMIYDFAPLERAFDPVLMALSFGAALLCSMGSTYASCRAELTRPAAELLRPKAPKAGKRIFLEYITPLWKRLSFLRKVSIRNVFRYRSRLIMMLLGIGGCSALLLAGFGILDCIGDVAENQFSQITYYDYAVNFQDPLTQEDADQYLAEVGRSKEDALLVHSGTIDIISDDVIKSVYIVVPTENSLDGFIDLHSGDQPIPFPKSGEVIICNGLSDDLNVSPGDTVTLRDDDLGSMEVTLSSFCNNYIGNYIYVSMDTYRDQLGDTPDAKTLFLLEHGDVDHYQEGVRFAESDDVTNVTVNASTKAQVEDMLSRLDLVIVIVVGFAAALAFIVLYNLTNINITERIREIATIKVLGFYPKETATYVFRELTMLSFGGSIVGLFMGKALLTFVIAQVQVEGMFFPLLIKPVSYVIAVVITMVFSILITQCMKPRLNKINMAESLKSIE